MVSPDFFCGECDIFDIRPHDHPKDCKHEVVLYGQPLTKDGVCVGCHRIVRADFSKEYTAVFAAIRRVPSSSASKPEGE